MSGAPSPPPDPDRIRADKWLWFARFFKTRALAARFVSAGHLRINARRTSKPASFVRPGDVLTITLRGGVRVVHVVCTGNRRGSASDAQLLYEDVP